MDMMIVKTKLTIDFPTFSDVEFIGFGAMVSHFPYEFMGFGAMVGYFPYEFMRFGAMVGNFPMSS